MQSGLVKVKDGLLEFETQIQLPIHLMGWERSDNTLVELNLEFSF